MLAFGSNSVEKTHDSNFNEILSLEQFIDKCMDIFIAIQPMGFSIKYNKRDNTFVCHKYGKEPVTINIFTNMISIVPKKSLKGHVQIPFDEFDIDLVK
jgi:hypothetical protein